MPANVGKAFQRLRTPPATFIRSNGLPSRYPHRPNRRSHQSYFTHSPAFQSLAAPSLSPLRLPGITLVTGAAMHPRQPAIIEAHRCVPGTPFHNAAYRAKNRKIKKCNMNLGPKTDTSCSPLFVVFGTPERPPAALRHRRTRCNRTTSPSRNTNLCKSAAGAGRSTSSNESQKVQQGPSPKR